jgi:outer membrane lipoprotein-sorting protein
MRNPITKLSVAAIVAVVCVIVVVMWTRMGSSIVLADALAQLQRITSYAYQMTMTTSNKDRIGRDMNETMEGSILISQDYGMKIAMDSVDPNSGRTSRREMYMLFKEKTGVILMPDLKMYNRTELPDTLIERTRQENCDPRTMLKQILGCRYESLGRSTIDGVEVEGFQTTDPNCLNTTTGQKDMKIWVDIRTQLPVRLEMDEEKDGARMHVVVHDFQWNCPVTAADFTPVIPADYTNLDVEPTNIPGMSEESAIAGLKLCADLTGRYPEKLDSTAVFSLMDKVEPNEIRAPKGAGGEHERFPTAEDSKEAAKLSEEERLKQMEEMKRRMGGEIKKKAEESEKTIDRLMPIDDAVTFYEMLSEEEKDPAYYGSVVTPQDADKVLMRWKVSDNQYRVIFGNLRAETVDTEALAKLEKDLPR